MQMYFRLFAKTIESFTWAFQISVVFKFFLVFDTEVIL